jgi:5-formyltetrahydrofolate cyclo-ligase
VVYVPTPGLAGKFHRLDPTTISSSDFAPAALMSNITRFGVEVSLNELPQMDGIVTGSVAVTLSGKRCGKGAGYSDIEYAILEELGHAPVPVATTVHEQQIVGDFPVAAHDVSLSLIVTPNRALQIATTTTSGHGVAWDLLSSDAMEKVPLLLELRVHLAARATRVVP